MGILSLTDTYKLSTLIRMQSKLTLSIPKEVLHQAKLYSKRTHQPLSQLVSRFFTKLAKESDSAPKNISAKVKMVTGIAKTDRDDTDALIEALSEKYL